MKPVNIIFEDDEMEFLKRLKKESWHDFILKLANEYLIKNNENNLS